jgi:hypothetical protein
MMLSVITRWLLSVREAGWTVWLAIGVSLGVFGLDVLALGDVSHSGPPSRLYDVAHALTGLEIFVGLPLLRWVKRRERKAEVKL